MIIVRLKGGMGNQMFQYALGRALSLKYNVPLGLDLSFILDRTPRPKFHQFTFRDYGLGIFNIKARIVSGSEIPFIYRQHFSGKIMIYINGFLNKFNEIFFKKRYFNFDPTIFNKGPDLYLNGNWHSYKYFKDIENIIREDFTPKNRLALNIQNLKEIIEIENSLCIHVRRGDYVGNSKYEIVNRNYYEKGIEKIKNLVKIDKIYIFSDDIKWCQENMKFNYPTMFIGEEYLGIKDEGHLALMSACRYFIIPNSSFSWWGAWLSNHSNKMVVVPKQWSTDKNINSDDLIPKEWIKI